MLHTRRNRVNRVNKLYIEKVKFTIFPYETPWKIYSVFPGLSSGPLLGASVLFQSNSFSLTKLEGDPGAEPDLTEEIRISSSVGTPQDPSGQTAKDLSKPMDGWMDDG